MTRIDSRGVDYCALQAAAEQAGVKLTYRVARCQHGYTSNQTCAECENGYVDDCHRFANLPEVGTVFLGGENLREKGIRHLFALTDNLEEVACLTDTRLRALSANKLWRFLRVLTEGELRVQKELDALRNRLPIG